MEDFEQFERRAEEAEELIASLTNRIEALENGRDDIEDKRHQGGEELQRVMLAKLLELRETMREEKNEADLVLSERDNATRDRDELRDENEKLKFRIKHLLRTLEEKDSMIAELSS